MNTTAELAAVKSAARLGAAVIIGPSIRDGVQFDGLRVDTTDPEFGGNLLPAVWVDDGELHLLEDLVEFDGNVHITKAAKRLVRARVAAHHRVPAGAHPRAAQNPTR